MHERTPESLLFSAYLKRFKGLPEWAYPLPPPIPFVGREYASSTPRIALYASAENLTHYQRRPESMPDFVQDERAWNRHRHAFESGPMEPFPRMHIAPMENGSLLCAVLFILQEHLASPAPEDPWRLAERLAIANVAKFSIRTEDDRNRDYLGNRERLGASLPLFRADLETLTPDVLILPKAVWKHTEVRSLVATVAPGAKVIPVPQFNATVVNVHLSKYEERARELAENHRDTKLGRWTSMLKGYAADYPYRYYAALEQILG